MNQDTHFTQFKSHSEHPIKKWKDAKLTTATDCLAEEVPVALIYNGISHVVMLATPQNLEDFALGFSLTEGILQDKSELYDVESVAHPNGIELQLSISAESFANLKEHKRNMMGRTGCGLCGAENLEQVMRVSQLKTSIVEQKLETIPWQSIKQAYINIQPLQKLQQLTGATHACAWVDVEGNVELIREDVGRHNALDKLIGALVKKAPVKSGFVLTTSRASYEMVQKVVSVGINMIAAISAPTALATRIADARDVTLIGFVRQDQHVVYTHAERIQY